jgi:hypothetical protein
VLSLAAPSVSNGWFALIGALGGVVTAGIFALATALLNHHWQRSDSAAEYFRRRQAEMFQERKLAYAQYIANSNVTWHYLNLLCDGVKRDGPRPDPQELSESIAKSEGLRAEIILLANEAVVEAVQEYDNQQAAARQEARAGNELPYIYPAYVRMLEAMRAEIGQDATGSGVAGPLSKTKN